MAAMSIIVYCTDAVKRYFSDVCSMTYLECTVHHTNYVVKLLVVHDCTVLLNMKTQFLSKTLASCLAFQCAQCSWQRL